MPRFLFRADVSPATGLGHLRRCLTLARELSELGCGIYFLCRAEGIDLARFMPAIVSEYRLMDWSTGPEEDVEEVTRMYDSYNMDAAVVDHYRADEKYQETLFGSGIRWLQFDGAARHQFWADWVLNMSPAAARNLYSGLVRRDDCHLLMGPAYAVLRREFRDRTPARQTRMVRRILLTFGGGSDRGATLFCLKAIEGIDDNMERIVLTSSSNPYKDDIVRWCEDHRNTRLVMDADDVVPYISLVDLGITAGGMTVFEMAALGVPVLFLQIADNQVPISSAWEKKGFGINLGLFEEAKQETVLKKIVFLVDDEERRIKMSRIGRMLVDGRGAERVAGALLVS